MSNPGPTLLKSHLQAHSKDYSVTRLLTLLDINSKPERDAFASSLRSALLPFSSSHLNLLTPSQLHAMARTFLTSSLEARSPCNGTKYFPPAYLRNIPGFTVKKWSYDTHRETILEVVAQILSTQRKMQLDRKKRLAEGYEPPKVKTRKRRARERVEIGAFSGPESEGESDQPLAKRRRRPIRGCAALPPREPVTPSPPPREKTPSMFIDLTRPLTEPVVSSPPTDHITSPPAAPPTPPLRESLTAPTHQPNASFTSTSTPPRTTSIESSTSMARPRRIRDVLSSRQDIYPPSMSRQTRIRIPGRNPSPDPDPDPIPIPIRTPNLTPIELFISPTASTPNPISTASIIDVQPPFLSFPAAGEHVHINQIAHPFHAPSDTINGLPLFESVRMGLGPGMGIMPLVPFREDGRAERSDGMVAMMENQGEDEAGGEVETGARSRSGFARLELEMEGDVEVEQEVPESEYGEEDSIRDAGRGHGTRREKEIGQENIVSLARTRAQARREGFEAARQVCMEIYMELHRQAVLARGQEGKEAMVKAEGVLECFRRMEDVLEEREMVMKI